MTLEAGKEMDRRCVIGWLNEVYRNPTMAFITHSDEQLIEFAHDALVLLKEQEAVEPKTEPSAKGYWYTCGACGWWLFEVRDTGHFDDRKRIRFCASCGREVKWG